MPAVRAASAVVLLGVVGLSATGCGAYGAALRQREAVVYFANDATLAQHEAARTACTGYPNATPEPVPSSRYKSDQVADVRFRIDNASDADLAKLFGCLQKQPGVIGVNIPDKGN